MILAQNTLLININTPIIVVLYTNYRKYIDFKLDLCDNDGCKEE